MKSRRDFPRIGAEDEFVVDFDTQDFGHVRAVGIGKDISDHGICFTAFAPLKKGAELDLTVRLQKKFPGPSQVGLRAKVVRVYPLKINRHFRIACRLMDEEDYAVEIEIIRQFIHWMRLQHNPFDGKDSKAA